MHFKISEFGEKWLKFWKGGQNRDGRPWRDVTDGRQGARQQSSRHKGTQEPPRWNT